MSYNYLLNLYKALEQRSVDISHDLEKDSHGNNEKFLQGRIDCLKEVHAYLQQNYDRKLPRRLQQKTNKNR
jgi:hypothetical protein